MSDFFHFTQDTPVWLYGAASIGHIMNERLMSAGYDVRGFIDKRGDEISEFCGLPVFSLDEVRLNQGILNGIVFVAVKNVFEHEAIIRRLKDIGIKRLIYRPYSSLIGTDNDIERCLNMIYSQYFEGEHIPSQVDVPIIKNVSTYNYDYARVRAYEDKVIAYIPIDYIFTNDYSRSKMEKWGNLNIAAFFTHIDFFKYLSGDGSVGFDNYLYEYCEFTANIDGRIEITDGWRKNVLKNRTQIFQEMLILLTIDKDFFLRNPATAKWNSHRKFFNLTSGKHRCTFLASQNQFLIPLEISEDDYSIFLNEKGINKVGDLVSEIGNLNMPISHPYFYHLQGINYSVWYRLINAIILNVSRSVYEEKAIVSFVGLNVLIDYPDNGFLTSFFLRMGCLVKCSHESKILQAVCELGYQKSIHKSAKYDIVLTDDLDRIKKEGAPYSFLIGRSETEIEMGMENVISTIDSMGQISVFKYTYREDLK